MTLVDVTALRVPEGAGPEIEKRFATRKHAVNTAGDFEGFELLRPRFDEDHYFVITCWDIREHYDAWMAGRGTNAHAGDERREVSIELLEFEIIQYDEQNERIATVTQATAVAQVRAALL